MQTVIACTIIVLISCYLIYGIERLTGYKILTYEINEYIVAALDLYVVFIDIIKQICCKE